MTGLDVLVGVIGVIVTLVVGAAMVLLVPRGTVEDPLPGTRDRVEPVPDGNGARAVAPR